MERGGIVKHQASRGAGPHYLCYTTDRTLQHIVLTTQTSGPDKLPVTTPLPQNSQHNIIET